MGKHTFFVQLALTAVWVIMMEEISWRSVAIGLMISMLAVFFTSKFLPYAEIKNVRFFKLATYPFFLIGQIYLGGIQMMKAVLKGSVVRIDTVKTDLKAEALRVILGDSVTLTPGSVLLELEGDELTFIWFHDKKLANVSVADAQKLTAAPEKRLRRADLQ